MRKIIITLILVFSPCLPAFAGKSTIAVISFQPNGVSESAAKAVTELIQSELVKSEKYIVLERQRMNQVMNEIGFQQTGCTDLTCAVKVGKMLSAERIVIGNLIRAGDKMIISGRIVNVKQGISEFAAQEKVEKLEDLDKSVTNFVTKITGAAEDIISLKDYGWKCIKGNCADGEGTVEHPKGNKYSGEFRNGQFYGNGTIEYKDGSMYVGNFKDNMYDGFGTYYFPDGRKYVGKFKNNKFNGKGTVFDANGNIIEEGNYVDDRLQGCCLMFWKLQ